MPLSKDTSAAHDRGTGKVKTRSEEFGPRTVGEAPPSEPDPDSGLVYDRGTGRVSTRSEDGPVTVNAPSGEPSGRVTPHDGPVTTESPVPYEPAQRSGRDAGTGRTSAASEDSKQVSASSETVEDKAVRRRKVRDSAE